jgi:hypothetical protein
MMDAPTMSSKEEFVGGMVRGSTVVATSVPVEIFHRGGCTKIYWNNNPQDKCWTRARYRSKLTREEPLEKHLAADLCQCNGQQRETDETFSHLPSQMLQAIEGLQRQRLNEEDNRTHDEAHDSFFDNIIIIKHGQAVVEPRVLKAIQWAQESVKKSLISLHIIQPKETIFFIRP